MNGDFSELVEYLDKKFQKIVTKQDLIDLSVKLLPREDFGQFKQETKQDFIDIKETLNTLINSIDKLVKTISDLSQEYTMVTSKIDRQKSGFIR